MPSAFLGMGMAMGADGGGVGGVGGVVEPPPVRLISMFSIFESRWEVAESGLWLFRWWGDVVAGAG